MKLGGHSASLDETNKMQRAMKTATSNLDKYYLNEYEQQQKYRLGTVSNKLLKCLNRFYGAPTSIIQSLLFGWHDNLTRQINHGIIL